VRKRCAHAIFHSSRGGHLRTQEACIKTLGGWDFVPDLTRSAPLTPHPICWGGLLSARSTNLAPALSLWGFKRQSSQLQGP